MFTQLSDHPVRTNLVLTEFAKTNRDERETCSPYKLFHNGTSSKLDQQQWLLFLHVHFLKSSRVNSKSQLFPPVEGVALGAIIY